MLFLVVLETLLLALLLILLPPLVREMLKDDGLRTAFPVEHILLWIGLFSGGLALVFILELIPARAVRGDAINLSPWFLLACGLFCVGGFGLRVAKFSRSLHSSQTKGFQLSLPFAVSASALLISVYLAFTAIDHWWFLRGAEAGVAAPQAIGALDVNCPLALIRVTEQDVEYRCPSSVIFNERYTKPFLPWPLYRSGRSAQLKEKYDEMKRNLTNH